MINSIKIAMLIIAAALVAGGVTYWLAQSTHPDARITVEGIRRVAELATVEYRLAAMVDQTYESSAWIFGDFESDHLIAMYTGAVRGRVDLDNATVGTQSDADGDYVSIHFKRGSVLISGVEIDPEKDQFDLISCGGVNLGSSATDGQRKALRKEALSKIIETAFKTGIVEKTIENATTALSTFVSALGYRAVVTFDEHAYDPSFPKK